MSEPIQTDAIERAMKIHPLETSLADPTRFIAVSLLSGGDFQATWLACSTTGATIPEAINLLNQKLKEREKDNG